MQLNLWTASDPSARPTQPEPALSRGEVLPTSEWSAIDRRADRQPRAARVFPSTSCPRPPRQGKRQRRLRRRLPDRSLAMNGATRARPEALPLPARQDPRRLARQGPERPRQRCGARLVRWLPSRPPGADGAGGGRSARGARDEPRWPSLARGLRQGAGGWRRLWRIRAAQPRGNPPAAPGAARRRPRVAVPIPRRRAACRRETRPAARSA